MAAPNPNVNYVGTYGPPTSFGAATGALFSDPNFLSLIAGVGGALDPEGFGGQLAKATQSLVQSRASQKSAGVQQDAAHKAWVQAMANAYGGPSGPSTEGITKQSLDDKGNLTLTLTPPMDARPTMLQQPGYVAPQNAGTAPGSYSTPTGGTSVPQQTLQQPPTLVASNQRQYPMEQFFPL